ncbi:MAG: glycosyltransferase family protein [Gemmatimonadales bacterium]
MPSRARVLIPTLRRLNPHAAWCSNYEFEDVIRRVDDVDIVELEPAGAFELRQRIAHGLAWRNWHPALMRLNPGVRPVVIDRDYDLFVVVCMNVWDLLHLNAIRGWRERCRVKICFMVEFYSGLAGEYGHLLGLLGDFDHVVQSFSGTVAAVERVTGKTCHHLPLAADAVRFTPYPDPPARVIDILSMGRRSEPLHQALLGLAPARDLFYLHDTIPGALVRPSSPAQHRDMLANSAKRSRFFVTYPAKFGALENRGQSEVGARYFEGLAAGAVLLGQAPTAPAFRDDFPWPDAVVEARPDGSDIAEVLSDLEERPDEMRRLGVRNAVHALRHHDWGHRWQSMLCIAGAAPRPALGERLRTLDALARTAERKGLCA